MTTRRLGTLFPEGHGVHVGVSQKFLDELIRVESQDDGPVRDSILGAQVVGSQRTETSLHVQMIPCEEHAQLEFHLSGVTRNSTENRTPQAVIQSEGNHRFEVRKAVQFDGQQLLTRSPSAWIYPKQQNRAALTPASAIPILGPLVSEYALTVAEQRRPASERITAERITNQVVPQFNTSVDGRLSSLNTQLKDVLPKLLPLVGIETPVTRVRTTDNRMTVSFAWESVRNCPDYQPTAATADTAECRVAVHAEAVNVWLASLPLGGVEIPVSDLDRWQNELRRAFSARTRSGSASNLAAGPLRSNRMPVRNVSDQESVFPGLGEPTILGPILISPTESKRVAPSDLLDNVPTLATPEDIPSSNDSAPDPAPNLASQTHMILALDRPVSIEFGDGEAVITLVAAFRMPPAPQTENHRIQIPLTSRLEGGEWIVTPGTVRVETLAPSSGPLAEIVRSTIERQVQERLQETRWPVSLPLNREQRTPVTLRLEEMSSQSGWLSLVWGVEPGSVSGEPEGARLPRQILSSGP